MIPAGNKTQPFSFVNHSIKTIHFQNNSSPTIHCKRCKVLFPASIYLLKVNNRNTRTRCEIGLKLTIKTPE